jgi:hypothetical protein
MKTLNYSKAQVISQPTLFSVPTQSCTEPLRGSIKRILIAAGFAAAVAAPAWATQPPDEFVSESAGSSNSGAVDPESEAHAKWRALLAQNSTSAEGCFHASYPNTVWETVDCKIGEPRVRPVHAEPTGAGLEVTGSGNDYVAKAKGLITLASGGFTIKGVKSETGVGVAGYGYHGTLGPNEYTVQLNTNDKQTTSKCAGHSGCTVWQQFVYAPDYIVKGNAEVFMQYWLLGWGSSACPSGWTKPGKSSNCVKNSAYVEAPDLPITDLGKVALEGTATAGGKDSVTFTYGSDSYSITGKDSVLDISSVWNNAEFNVLGNAGGSRADFNSGSSVTVTLLLFDGSTSAPTCVADDGTTGESNNLNLGACTAYGGIPNISFTESN